MVIPSFYQFLIGFGEKYQSKYFFLTDDGQTVPTDIPAYSLSFHKASGTLYGIYEKDGRNVIGKAGKDFSKTDFSPIFGLSGHTLLYTAVSPDNQKIAFLATEKETGKTQIRVIAREEFGWFPLPAVRFDASPTRLCFCSDGILMYTSSGGELKAVRLTKPVRTVDISPNGYSPVFDRVREKAAFIKDNFIFYNMLNTEIKADFLFSFSREGKEILFSEAEKFCCYNVDTKQIRVLFRAPEPVTFATEL